MNYAEDRLDRRAKSSPTALHAAYCRALKSNDHVELARTLRDIGWNRHAVYHYAQALLLSISKTNDEEEVVAMTVGDYAQMAELAGFPEVGVLSCLAYRAGEFSRKPVASDFVMPASCKEAEIPNVEWLQQTVAQVENSNCGCGMLQCGSSPCWIPFLEKDIEPVYKALEEYGYGRLRDLYALQRRLKENDSKTAQKELHSGTKVPTAHEIIKLLTEKDREKILDPCHFQGVSSIPPLLQFWNTHNNNNNNNNNNPNTHQDLPLVIQLLLLKQLYLLLPSLSMEAAIALSANLSPSQERHLAQKYKSHHAYLVFIKALVLGERIKPHRRKMQLYYHVPLWDRLWGLDDYCDDNNVSEEAVEESVTTSRCKEEEKDAQRVADFLLQLKDFINCLRNPPDSSKSNTKTRPLGQPLYLSPFAPSHTASATTATPQPKILYIVGDSHVFSIAWQTIRILRKPNHPSNADGNDGNDRESRLAVPVVITGIKAWHTRPHTRFFTHSCMRTMLHRIMSPGTPTPADAAIQTETVPSTVVFSAGEIDCREGLGGPLLQGYTQDCHEHVVRTVQAYVDSLRHVLQEVGVAQALVMPVPPPLQRSKGRVEGQVSRRETMRVWNATLQGCIGEENGHQKGQEQPMVEICSREQEDEENTPPMLHKSNHEGQHETYATKLFYLDYTQALQALGVESYLLNPIFNADSTHLNGAFVPLLEKSLLDCGFKMDSV